MTPILTACAEDVRLRNPATGETAVCKAVNYSHDGLANQIDRELQMRCLDDYQRKGYEGDATFEELTRTAERFVPVAPVPDSPPGSRDAAAP